MRKTYGIVFRADNRYEAELVKNYLIKNIEQENFIDDKYSVRELLSLRYISDQLKNGDDDHIITVDREEGKKR